MSYRLTTLAKINELQYNRDTLQGDQEVNFDNSGSDWLISRK
jgi:hypothetical protein